MTRLWRNWAVHNLLGHPLSEVVYWLVRPFGQGRATDMAGVVHDLTVPKDTTNGRG